jgi:hypothetical protein
MTEKGKGMTKKGTGMTKKQGNDGRYALFQGFIYNIMFGNTLLK